MTAPSVSRWRALKMIYAVLAWTMFALLAGSMALRLVVSDTVEPLHWNSYLPSLFLVPLLLMASVAVPLRLRWKAIVLAPVAFSAAVAIYSDHPRLLITPDQPEDGDFSLLLYNVMAYRGDEEAIVEFIAEQRPEILCLVEGTFAGRAPDRIKKALGADYHWAVEGRLSIASRFPVSDSELLDEGALGLMRAELKTDRGPVTILLADAPPPHRRKNLDAFRSIGGEAQSLLPAGSAILCGDFNAPRGSRMLAQTARGWRDAFRSAAAPGYTANWPASFPLWQLDHVFHSEELTPASAAILDQEGSDHLPALVNFQWMEGVVRKTEVAENKEM